MQKLADTITLMAKTGLFFANADGEYAQEEKDFIDNFIASTENIGDIGEELKAQVLDALNHTYTLDDIIQETKTLLDGFTPLEQNAIKSSLDAFVNHVINVDNKKTDAEKDNYLEWQKAIQ